MTPGGSPTPSRDDHAAGAPRIAYMSGVDGLRAVAVAAVVVFHLGAAWLPGGFLGVDVFLVISGYLITSLLLAERDATGRIDLVRFWMRRARRLLPAVFLMLAVVLALMVVLHPGEVAGMRGAVLASLAYVTNWYFILADVPYFEQFGRPSLVLHLWSLAVEEQFYLVWPPILAAGLLLWGRRAMLAVALAGTVASAALAWWMFDPFSDTDRIYYGTDTRAVGLLAGVVLAFVLPAGRLGAVGVRRRRVTDALGVVSAVALAVLFVRLDETGARLYQGGFLVTAVVTAVLIAAAAQPGTRTGRVLGTAALVWIGKRSYGIYLWHWPAIHLTRPGEDVPFDGPPLVALQVSLTVVAAALSYRYVETPFRRHGLRGVRAALARRGEGAGLAVRRATAATAVSAVAALAIAVAVAPASSQRPAGFGEAPVPSGVASRDAALPPRVLMVGDSVMLGASPALRGTFGPGAVIDARVGRRFPEGVEAVVGNLRQLPAGTPVVVHLGNNYFVRPGDLDALMARLPEGHPLYLVTVRVALPWQDSVNTILREAPVRYPGVTVVDWHAESGGGGLLVDGAHTNARGSRLYADVLAGALTGTDPVSDPTREGGT